MDDLFPQVALPDEVFSGLKYTSIHAAMVFADLENSVMLASTLPPQDYDELINAFQHTMIALVNSLNQQGVQVGETSVAGDQLSVFIYDKDEIRRNYLLDGPNPVRGEERRELIRLCQQNNERIAYEAFKASLELKSLWLVQDFNMRLVRYKRNPMGLGIGIHYGRVYYRDRPDGGRRIEGYAVSYAKRVESYSRQGTYSNIMFSQEMRDTLRSAVVKHSQLRQRIFFHCHTVSLELMKGVARSQNLYELKFYHRLKIPIKPETYDQYTAMLALDRQNIWAYYQLFDHLAYGRKEWNKAYELAKMAFNAHPDDERVILDMARCNLHLGLFDQAIVFAEQALAINSHFDLAYELLAQIAAERELWDEQAYYWRSAVRLSPNSPVNNLNLGLVLLYLGRHDEGSYYIREAVRVYPGYVHHAEFQQTIADLENQGRLPDALRVVIQDALGQVPGAEA